MGRGDGQNPENGSGIGGWYLDHERALFVHVREMWGKPDHYVASWSSGRAVSRSFHSRQDVEGMVAAGSLSRVYADRVRVPDFTRVGDVTRVGSLDAEVGGF
jgi:hypothetical protein